ncbi:TRAF-like family protein [Citrus sinensis]|nr:TRAF-like family protein [Citrus sinensis]
MNFLRDKTQYLLPVILFIFYLKRLRAQKRNMNQENLKLEDILNNTSSFTLDWQVSAVFRMFLLDQNQENYCVVQDIMGKERRFNGLKHVWGFDKFIPLRDFNDASNGYLVEDTCVFEAEEDRATPMGTGPDAGLSLFLVFGDSTVRSTIKLYAEFTFRILDPWGWSTFVSLSKLNDPENGYLVNDVCFVEAEITVLRISEAL